MQARILVTALGLVLVLTACGDGDDGNEAAAPTKEVTVTETVSSPTPTVTETEPSPTPAGESDGCLVAANKWADRMTDHVLDASTTAPVFAETLNIDNLDDPTSTVKALCSEDLTQAILDANAKIAEINFELSLCGFSETCDPSQTRKVRRLADRVAGMVGDVRNLL